MTFKLINSLAMFKGYILWTLDSNTILTLGVLDGLRREFPFFMLKIAHRRGQLSDFGSHIIYGSSKFSVSGLLNLNKLCHNVVQTPLMWRLVKLLILTPLRRGVKTLVRIRRKSLRTLILELRGLI